MAAATTTTTMNTSSIPKPKGLKDYASRKASVDFGVESLQVLIAKRSSGSGSSKTSPSGAAGPQQQLRGSLNNNSINLLDAIFSASSSDDLNINNDDGERSWWEAEAAATSKEEPATRPSCNRRRHMRRRSISDSNLNEWFNNNNKRSSATNSRPPRGPHNNRRSGGASSRTPINFTVRKDIVLAAKDGGGNILDGEPGSDSTSRLSYDHYASAASTTTTRTSRTSSVNNTAAPNRNPMAGSLVTPPKYWINQPKPTTSSPRDNKLKKEAQIQWLRNHNNNNTNNPQTNIIDKRFSDPTGTTDMRISMPCGANGFVTGSRIRRLTPKSNSK